MASTMAGNKTEEAKDLLHKGKDAAAAGAEKAKEAASGIVDKAKDAAGKATTMAGDAAAMVGDKADDATHSVGSGMRSVAGSMRETMPKEGVLGSAACSVAKGLETSGRYLEQAGLRGIAEDVTNFVRRNPLPAIFLGVGLGFLLAHATLKTTRR